MKLGEPVSYNDWCEFRRLLHADEQQGARIAVLTAELAAMTAARDELAQIAEIWAEKSPSTLKNIERLSKVGS